MNHYSIPRSKLYAVLNFLLKIDKKYKRKLVKKKATPPCSIKLYDIDEGSSLHWRKSLAHHIKNSVVSQRWNTIGHYFPAMFNMENTVPHFVFKLGLAAMCASEASEQDILKYISTGVRLGVKDCSIPMLDAAIYLVCHNHLEEANMLIALHFDTIKRYPKKVGQFSQCLRGLQGEITAFQALKIRNDINNMISSEENQDEVKLMQSDAAGLVDIAVMHFREIFEESTPWDNLVELYSEVLSFQEDSVDGAVQILKDYIGKKPHSPTSYILLINFLKKHCPEKRRSLIKPLRQLAALCPSDSRLLELCDLLGENDLKYQFKLLANIVDYFVWKDDVEVWKRLSNVVEKMMKPGDEAIRKFIRKFWKQRAIFWTRYHFSDLLVEAQEAHGDIIQYKIKTLEYVSEFKKKWTGYGQQSATECVGVEERIRMNRKGRPGKRQLSSNIWHVKDFKYGNKRQKIG